MEDGRESERLKAKVDPDWVVSKYIATYLKEDGSFLDVGCGPGIIAKAVTSISNTEVVGVDLNRERFQSVDNLGISKLMFIEGNIESLPLKTNQFDVAFSRFLFEYLPNKELALGEMVRVCKPGGTIILQDLDFQLNLHYPIDPSFQGNIDRVLKKLEETGFDSNVGRKLYSLMYKNGLENISIEIEPYHVYAGTIDHKNEELWATKLDIVRPKIIEALGEDQTEIFIESYMDYLRDPATLTYSILFTIVGKKAI